MLHDSRGTGCAVLVGGDTCVCPLAWGKGGDIGTIGTGVRDCAGCGVIGVVGGSGELTGVTCEDMGEVQLTSGTGVFG